jgi:hypothetical protein
MTWTFDEIQRDWLGGSVVATPPEEIVHAFDRCQRVLGRDWIDGAKQNAKGSAPTLAVAAIGQSLASLEDIAIPEQLINKLRRKDPSAFAELRAIYLLRSRELCRVELEPPVSVGGRQRKCDFRVQRQNEPWVYVEVTQPAVSEAQARVQQLLNSIVDVVNSVHRPFALEVFCRREPSDDEIAPLVERIRDFCSADHRAGEAVQQEVPDGLGVLFLNHGPAGQIVLNDHGEKPVPRLCAARGIVGPEEPHRHIAVRVPYADARAEQFLTAEARQLPTDSPGLIMVEMARAPGGFRSWEPVLRRRLQPSMHTRVGGIILFSSGQYPTSQGEASLFETKFINNPHARIPLPPWIEAACTAINDELAAKSGKR